METEAVHKQNFYEFEKMLRERWPGMLPIGAGCCTKCKTCTYPDAPCRFPEQAFSSMEAYWNAGNTGMPGKWSGILLWSLHDRLYQLLSS